MVSELDESDGSFELFACHIPVITNIDWDHVNFYPLFNPFKTPLFAFIESKSDGKIVICGEDIGCQAVSKLFSPFVLPMVGETMGLGRYRCKT